MQTSPRNREFPRTSLLPAALVLIASLVGCGANVDVSVRPIFNGYEKVAIWPDQQTELGLQRIYEEVLLPRYMNAFPKQSIIDRRDLDPILGEQEFLPDRLDDETRAKIREIKGVEAIVAPNYTAGPPSQLAVKVIDTETGENAAACVVLEDGKRGDESERAVAIKLIRQAVAALETASQRTGH